MVIRAITFDEEVQQGYVRTHVLPRDGQTIVYSAQWNNDPLQVYTVRMEFPQSTKVDLPSAILLALSASGNMEIAVDPTYNACGSRLGPWPRRRW
jgi:hypothetical protein